MRTSTSQFQLLVEFMERYGDLSKPTEGPQGRANNLKRWAEITQLLNADATGESKTAEKWRKVWSDFKNNTKKKAARIYQASRGTGGGPALNSKLNDLEQKVLAIIGAQAATGLVHIPEIGLEEMVVPPPPERNNSVSILIEQLDVEHDTSTTIEDWIRPGTSTQSTVLQPLVTEGSQREPRHINNSPAADSRPPLVPQETGQPVLERPNTVAMGLPLAAGTSLPSTRATPLPLTPRRRRRDRLFDPSSPIQRRTRTQTQSDLARQAFVRSDCEWRAFQQETEREKNRLRELELRNQGRWLDLFGQFLLLGNRVVDILEKKWK